MSQFKVANLPNLFWDNGSFKYPSTYPRLLNAEVKNKTPVMTSPTTGWVILEGDYNYCEFKGELFFLKKDRVISHKRNKWFYILIKDHICSLFKNKAGVIAQGTLTNTDIKNLDSNDFQFTFPVFSNYNKRILIPLTKAPYDWREHGLRKKITKQFEHYFPIDNKSFSNFVYTLEANKILFTQSPSKPWSEAIKGNDSLVILGRLGKQETKVKGWKNELVEKINAFLDEMRASNDIVLGVVSGEVIRDATKIEGRYGISHQADNPMFKQIITNKEIDIDLSGLTDIELINFDKQSPSEKYTRDHFNLFLSYDENAVSATYKNPVYSFVYKLCRRVRLPFLNEYSTRAIVKYGGNHYPFCWKYPSNQLNLFLPQKLFFKNPDRLTLKDEGSETARKYNQYKATDNYRSVYLYWVFDFNFYFAWGDVTTTWKGDKGRTELYKGTTWINNLDYFTDNDKQNILRSVSGNFFFRCTDEFALQVVPAPMHKSHDYLGIEGSIFRSKPDIVKEYWDSYYPWSTLDPINIGWLIGQFSSYISGQENYFEANFPFVVRAGVTGNTKLKRIKGLKREVANLVHMDDLFNLEGRSNIFTLDIFNPLPRRTQEYNKEEDFLIGEKLLFSTWGMAPYLLFQPAFIKSYTESAAYGSISQTVAVYAYYNGNDLDNYYQPQLFFKWIEPRSWHFAYTVFDEGSYFKQNAKQWFKKAYDSYKPLDYQRFYENKDKYKTLVTHAVKNTGAYFETEEVDFKTNSIKELKVNDIFFSDQEWYWYDASGGNKLGATIGGEFLRHSPVWNQSDGKQLEEDEIVAYLNPKNNKIYLGKVCAYTDRVKLSEGQYIATGTQISSDSSTFNFLDVRYTRITPLTDESVTSVISGFDSIDVLINTLKGARYMKQTQPVNLKQLQDQARGYLFDLKGTPFFCHYDRLGRVSLIFKNKDRYNEAEHIPN